MPAPLFEYAFFFHFIFLASLSKNQVFIGVWIDIQVFDLVPLVLLSVFRPIPGCFHYCSRDANQNNSETPSFTCKNGQDQKHWQFMPEKMWGKGNTSALLVEVQTGVVTLKINMVSCQKIKKQHISRPSDNIFVYIPKGCSIIP